MVCVCVCPHGGFITVLAHKVAEAVLVVTVMVAAEAAAAAAAAGTGPKPLKDTAKGGCNRVTRSSIDTGEQEASQDV